MANRLGRMLKAERSVSRVVESATTVETKAVARFNPADLPVIGEVVNSSESLATASKVPNTAETNYVYFNKTHKDSLPKPKGRGPNDGRLQSHHGLQQQWAKENLAEYGYDADLAPSITIETGKGHPHTAISKAQNARRDARVSAGEGKWNSSLQEELHYIVDDMSSAGFQKQTTDQVLEQQYKMLDKLKFSYQKINNQ